MSAPVQLSTYSFSADSPAIIYDTDSMPTPYRLRAKIVNYTGTWSAIGLTYEHLADSWNNDYNVLNHVPYPGSYTVLLYWVLYDSTGTTVLQVGPLNNTQTITVFLGAPNVAGGSSFTQSSLTVNWNPVMNATGYYVDISTTSNFSSFVGSYANYYVGNVSSLSLSGLSPGTPYYYRVRATNGNYFSGYSSTRTVATVPSITSQPTSQTVNVGQPVTMNVGVAGTATFAYQWYKNGTAIAGATGSSYTLTNPQESDSGSYSVNVSDLGGNQTSSTATLSVVALVQLTSYTFSADAPAHISDINNFISSYRLRAKIINYSGTWASIGLTYEHLADSWNNNNNPLDHVPYPGTYTVQLYWVLYDSTETTVLQVGPLTNTRTITVVLGAPSVATGGTSVTSSSFTANWSTVINGTGYYLDISTDPNFGSFVSPYNTYAVGNTPYYSVSGLAPGSTYYYRVRSANGSVMSAYSQSSAVTTTASPPVITTQPVGQMVTEGAGVTFTVAATGSSTLAYQWYKNMVQISGATSSTYTIANTTTSTSGSYSVWVIDAAGVAKSAVVVLTINPVYSANRVPTDLNSTLKTTANSTPQTDTSNSATQLKVLEPEQ